MHHRTPIYALLALAALLVVSCGSNSDNNKTTGGTTPQVTQVAATQSPATQAAAGTSSATQAAAASTYQPQKVSSSVTLTGAGSTFANPLYTKASDTYNKQVDPNVKVNYQAIGSSGGIKNFTEKTVDFGASDAYMTPEQIQAAGGIENVIHIPTALGAIVLTWNLPGYNGGLKLTPDTLAGIYLGQIKKWNDAKLKAENPGASLPDAEIAVVYRSDGSGTTNAFTSYLAKISQTWKSQVGAGTTVQWPTGIGANGNDGVTGQIKQTPGAIGYVELIYAEQNKLPEAEVKNKSGNFVKPSLDSTAAAADTSAIKDDLSADLLDTSGAQAYPIVTMTWIMVYKNQTDQLKATALTNFLWWLTHAEGQKVASGLLYAPLPTAIIPMVEGKLKQVTVGGKPIIQ